MKKLCIIAAVVITVVCCKKTDTSPSVRDLLVSKTWKSTGFISNGSPSLKWCWLNSLYNYTNSGTLFLQTGDNLGACSSSDPIGTIYKANWKLSSDNKWLITQYSALPPGEADSFEIISIDASQLKTKRIVNKSSTPSTWEDTFTAQ